MCHFLKGKLQCQNKWILPKRPLKVLQNEAKIIKIHEAVLDILNCEDQDLDRFLTRKKQQKTENVAFLEVLHKLKNNGLCDIRNGKCTIKQ